MARTSTPQPVEKDPTYKGRRANDSPGFYAWAFVENMAWPVAAIAIAFLASITAVYLLHGQERVVAYVQFLQGPAVLGLIGAVLAAAVRVVASVPHTARLERRQAATQAGVEEATQAATASAARVDNIAAFVNRLDGKVDRLDAKIDALGGGPREPDPTTGELVGIVKMLAERMGRIEANTAAAAAASRGAQDTVVGYGGYMADFATAVRSVTGSTPAQQPADPPRSGLWTPGSTGDHPDSHEPPEARTARDDYADDAGVPDWSRREGSHRAYTAQQSAVSGPADEQEDWREGDSPDDGEGLDTGLVRGFRSRMAQADADERAARAEPPPAWPGGTRPVADADLPPHIRAARDRAREQMRREREQYWSNPEEGPQ